MAKADDLKARMGLSGPALEHFQSAPPAIPDHELVRRVGQGSYGEVWLARSAVGTWRAVKVVYRDHFKDARPYDREFSGIQKYEPISRTNEGLVDVLQIGRNDAEGYFYYVMELADDAGLESRLQAARALTEQGRVTDELQTDDRLKAGLQTDDRLKAGLQTSYIPKTLAWAIQARGRLPMEECITLGLTLNLALGHLHRSGLIHRDVKPSNIIFVNGVPKLADIGLVTDLAEAQSFVGTEGFIPPEGPNSPQADIYALGKVLYEASMGKDRQEFPEPFTRLGLDAESKALMELNAVLLKACAPQAKERYQTAEEMNADLALLHSGKSVKDKHALERRLKLTRRAAVVIVAVMVLAVVPYYLAIKEARLATAAAKQEAEQREQADQATRDAKAARVEERKHRVQAEADEKKAQTEAAKSKQVAQFLKDMLKGVGPSVALGRDTKMLREILDKTAERIGKDLTDQPEVEAELQDVVARLYIELGEYQKAEKLEREALAFRRKVFGNEHKAVAVSISDLARILQHESKLSEAETLHREVLAMLKKLLGDEHPDVAASLLNLANVLHSQGKLAEAETLSREALAMNRKLLGDEHSEVAVSLDHLAAVLTAQGKPVAAEPLHREALAMKKRLFGDVHPSVAASLVMLAELLCIEDQLGEAESLHREALAMRQILLGNQHPDVARSLSGLADVLEARGKPVEAESLHRQALAMRKKLLGSEALEVAVSLSGLARALQAQGKLVEAEALEREALAMRKKLLGSEDLAVANSLNDLATVCLGQGKLSEAETLKREALAMRKKLLGNDHPKVAESLNNLAIVLSRQHKPAEAETLYREALPMIRKALGKEHRNVAATLSNLAYALDQQGKRDEAETMLREALAMLKKSLGDEHPEMATTLGTLAGVLEGKSKLSEAETLYRQSLAMQKKLLGNEDPSVVASANNLAAMLRKQGKLAEAEALFREQLVYVQQHHTNNPAKLSRPVERLMDLLLAQHKYVEAEQLFNEVLTADIQNQPASAALFRSRANLHARRGLWKEAATDMTKAVALEPTNHVLYHALAPLLVAAGDEAGYGQFCRQTLTRFGGVTDPVIAQLMAKACLIQRCSLVDLNATDKLADIAAKGDPAGVFFPWLQFAKGLNEYRHDRFGEAVAWMQKVLATTGPEPSAVTLPRR
jgi:tetratricopeptide (TPR) repeat protein